MQDAPTFYVVRFWVDPANKEPVFKWLDGKHASDLAAEPGFLWVRRLKLAEDAADGWLAYMMIYGVDSPDSLQRYFNGPSPARYAEERRPYQQYLRMERCWGDVDLAVR